MLVSLLGFNELCLITGSVNTITKRSQIFDSSFVIPAEGARFAVLLKHSKRCGGFATMHSHDTHRSYPSKIVFSYCHTNN